MKNLWLHLFSCTWWKFDMTDFLQWIFAVAININVNSAQYMCYTHDVVCALTLFHIPSHSGASVRMHVWVYARSCTSLPVSLYLYISLYRRLSLSPCVPVPVPVSVCVCVCAHLPKCGRATGEVLNDGQVLTNVGPVWKTYLSNMHAYQQPTIKAYQFFQKVFLISFKFHSVLPFLLSVELLFGVWHTNVCHCRISI